MESLVNWFTENLDGLPKEWIVFIISMFPILELRGGLIAARLLMGSSEMIKAIFICFAGNILPIPFILLFITKIFDKLKQTKRFKPMVEKLENKATGKKSNTIRKYEFIGIILFVGIPLPGTGAWTGSLIAALLGVKLKKSIPAICIGLVMATTIMCIALYNPWLGKLLGV